MTDLFRNSRRLSVLALLSIAALSGAQSYRLVDLGSIAGNAYGYSFSGSINASGQVTGQTETANGPRAFRYSGGALQDLGHLGGNWSQGVAINSLGQVAGSSELGPGNPYGTTHAFLTAGGVMNDLGTLGGNYSGATGVNAAGNVVGYSTITANGSNYHAFLYSNGVMQDIDFGTYYGSQATGINDAGQITVDASDFSNARSYLVTHGSKVDLGSLGGSYTYTKGLNAAGQVVGYSAVAGNAGFRAFLYSGGTMTNLGTLGGASTAVSVNASGTVVGSSTLLGNQSADSRAFVYRNGAMRNLNDLLDASGTGWTLTSATGINDAGDIVAFGTSRYGYGPNHAVLLKANPVPEPTSLAALGLGAVAVLRRRKRG